MPLPLIPRTQPDWSALDRALQQRRSDRDREVQRNAMMQFAGGDPALAAAAQTGNAEFFGSAVDLTRQRAGDMKAQQQAQEKRKLDLIDRTMGAIDADLKAGSDPIQAFRKVAPGLKYMGATDEELAGFMQGLTSNPSGFLQAVRGKVAAKKYEIRQAGEDTLVIDPETAGLVKRYRGIVKYGPEDTVIDYAEDPVGAAPMAAPQGQPPAQAAPASATGAGGFDAFVGSLRRVESGGRPRPGQPTQYGTAQGTMQVLDSTGQAMAERLGVAWRPDLMRGTSPEAVAYQDKIGRAYAQEAWQASGGDPRVAAMYYHGGPDRKLWGPKTRRHGDRVMANMGAVSGGLGEDRLTGGGEGEGYRVIQRGRPKAKDGWRPATVEEKRAYGLAPSAQAQVSSDGKIDIVGGNTGEGKITDGQRNSASFTYAILGGNERMNELANEGIFKPTPQLLVSETNDGFRLTMSNEKDRLFVQAAKEFLAPVLRKDTGAAVTDTEFVFYQDIYIPRPEDSPTLLWRKAQARDTAIRRLYGSASRAYQEEYGTPPKWKVLAPKAGQDASVNRRKRPTPKTQGDGWKVIP